MTDEVLIFSPLVEGTFPLFNMVQLHFVPEKSVAPYTKSLTSVTSLSWLGEVSSGDPGPQQSS